jgi:hypothetical protein
MVLEKPAMPVGTCKLCLKVGDLLKSHMMPAALYGDRRKEFQVTTLSGTVMTKTQMKQHLLCRDCEQRFDRNGESHVLGAIAPKNSRAFPLHDRMKIAYPRDSDSSSSRFFGPDFRLDMDQFAYFAVSVVWRATVGQWVMQDGNLTQEAKLGVFQENMRKYLLGEISFPSDMAVIVAVCSDLESRKRFFHPSGFVEANCINFRFLARGVFFRVMMGYAMSPYLREWSCTSPMKCIWYGDCEKRTMEDTVRRFRG